MEIFVTCDDIERGIRRNDCACPVAHALNRHLGGEWSVGAKNFCRIQGEKYGPPEHDTPAEAMLFIKLFDAGQPVKPFSFTLNPTT